MRLTGLIEPGSLVSWRYALQARRQFGASGERPAHHARANQAGGAESGFTVRDRRDPSPQVSRTLERLRQFLTLVGLTALLVGGVGVAMRSPPTSIVGARFIATFKSLGATAATSCGSISCR